ncbi:MAG: hypothetical protein J5U17_06945 [Candidatus Methanoperedens sp.]|nr:hypothetical protein [Candidatus Methanoperedens sp.]MCE8428646.1 hypothetical protein [Candidatus Methanoperedens sp.]
MNSLVCIAITFSTAAFAYSLHKKRDTQNIKSLPSLEALIWFWALIGTYYFFEGVRMVSSYVGSLNQDVYLFDLASIPFVLISVPLAYFIIYIISGSKRTSLGVSLVFALFGAAYMALMYLSGITGPQISYWGSIYSINSNFALLIHLSGLYIVPTGMILGLMVLILFERVTKVKKYKVAMSLFSISFVSDFILLNSIVGTGEMQMASRIFVFIGTVLGFLAFFPPESLKATLTPHFIPYAGEEEAF